RLATNPTLFPYTTLFRSVIDGLGELTEVEKAQFDARRYLGISSRELLSYTPREFAIEMKAETERIYDEMEREAIIAIMHANANNSKKRIRPSDLFKRPRSEERRVGQECRCRCTADEEREGEDGGDALGKRHRHREQREQQ